MDELKDFLKEDGYLSVADCSEIHKIIFHPNLNIILIFTKDLLLVLDVNSGVVLQRVTIAGNCNQYNCIHFFKKTGREKSLLVKTCG